MDEITRTTLDIVLLYGTVLIVQSIVQF